MNAPVFKNLATDVLDSADGLEVVTSYVELPGGTQLPKHTHPGEEFAYVVEGEVFLWEDGLGETLYVAGETAKVPMGAVHTVRTGESDVKLVVFRVHTQGQPERILIDS